MRTKAAAYWMLSFTLIATLFFSFLPQVDARLVQMSLPAAPASNNLYGYVKTSAGSGMGNVTVNCSGPGLNKNVNSGVDGYYSCGLVADGVYTITPSKTGWTFAPSSRTVTVSGSPTQVGDFTGTQTGNNLYGYVKTSSGSGMGNVTVNCSGPGLNKNVNSSVDGYYSCGLVENGTYTITPSKTGWTFSPSSRTVTVSGSPTQVADFTGTQTSNNLYGYVKTSSGSGMGNVTVHCSGPGLNKDVSSGTDGYYSCGLVVDGTFTITPSKSGWTFSPTSRTVTVSGSPTQVGDFIGTQTGNNLYGYVKTSSGSGMGNVTVNCSGPGLNKNVDTGTNGYYSCGLVVDGTYTITPSKSGWTFSPSSRTVTVSGSPTQVADFTGTQTGNNLYGYVKTSSGSGMGSVTVNCSGPGLNENVTTNTEGYYSCGLVVDGTYTLTPSKTGWAFSPTSRTITVSGSPIQVPDFIGTMEAYNVTGTVTDVGGSPLAAVTISDDMGHSTTTISDGTYVLGSLTAGTYTVTPYAANYSFTPASRTVTVGPDATGQDFVGTLSAGSLAVTVKNIDGAVRSNAVVKRFDDGWTYIDQQTTNASGVASFADIPVGTYNLEAWYTPMGQSPAATELWGSISASVTSGSTTNVEILRSWPTLAITDPDPISVPTSIEVGGQAPISIKVFSPRGGSYTTRVKVILDRDTNSPYDISEYICSPPAQTIVGSTPYTFDCTSPAIQTLGTYHVYYQIEGETPSGWVPTDQNNWQQSFEVAENRPPELELSYPNDGETLEDATPNFSWSGSDPDGDPVTYELYVDNDSTPLSGPSYYRNVGGSLSHEPSPVDALENGSYSWAVVASDGTFETTRQRSFTIGSAVVRPEPSFTVSPSSLSMNVGDQHSLGFELRNDGDAADPVYLSVSFSSGLEVAGHDGNWQCFPPGSVIWRSIDTDQATLVSQYWLCEVSTTMSAHSSSNYEITIRAKSGGEQWVKARTAMNPQGTSASNHPDTYIRYPDDGVTQDQQGWYAQFIPVSVQSSLAAVAEVDPVDPQPGQTVRLIGSNSVGSPTGWQWEWASGFPKIIPQDNQQAVARVTLNEVGIYEYRLTVEKDGVQDTATMEINVGQVPRADAGTDQTSMAVGSTVQLNGTGSDPLSRPLHYEWQQIDGPLSVQLSDPNINNPSFNLTEAGVYEFKLVVWVEQDGSRLDSSASYVRIGSGREGTVSGVVFRDTDADGLYTAGIDTTVDGASVRANGLSVESAANGSYSLTLAAGTYDLSASKAGEGTGYVFGVTVLSDGSETANVPLGSSNCTPIGSIQVCADDLIESSPGSGIWTGNTNIRVGSHLVVKGNVLVDSRTGQEKVSGSGVVGFDLWDGTTLGLYEGDYEVDIHSAMVDIKTGAQRKIEEVVGFHLISEPSIDIDASGSLRVSNAQIEFQKPHPTVLNLVEFVINEEGEFSGSVQSFTTKIGDMELSVTDTEFNNEGLLLNGSLALPNTLSGGSSSLDVEGLALTRDGVNLNSIVLENYSLDIGGMTANLSHARLSNEGIEAAGSVQIPSDITPDPIAFDGIVITQDGIQGGQVHVETLQNVVVGPATFNFHGATLEMVNSGTGIKPVIFIAEANMVLDDGLGGGGVAVEDLVISNTGITFREGFAALPTIHVGHFMVKDTWVRIEQLAETGYAFEGEGTLVVQQLAPGSQNTAITAGVYVHIQEGSLEFKRAKLGISGPRIPLGSTGAFITGLYGEVDFTGEAVEFSVEVDLEAGPRVGELVAISGQVGTTINLDGWMRLDGNMKLFSYEVTEVSLSINQPGVSDRGVRGSLHLDVFAVFIGDATIYVYVDDSGSPLIEGSADVLVQLPLDDLPGWAQVIVGDDVSNVPLGRATASLGEFNGVYGINASAAYLNPSKPDEPLFELTVFVDAEGTLELGFDWHNPFWGGAPHVVRAERNAALPAVHLQKFPGEALQDSSLVTLDGNAEWVTFYLDATGYPYLTFSLIDPDGNVIDPSNTDQYPAVTLGRLGELWTYLVANPSAGDWYMVVDGLIGGESYQSEAYVKDSAPSIQMTGVDGTSGPTLRTLQAASYEISWLASDPENSATLSLYYDTDNAGFDGVLIASGLTLDASPYSWTPMELPTGDYYIYAKVEDNANAPMYSYFGTPIHVVNDTVPAVPTDLSARAGINTAVLAWTPNIEPDLSGYEVQYSSEPGQPTEIMTTTERTVIVPRPDLSKPLTMTVAAYDTSGNQSLPSAPILVAADRVDDAFPPEAPAGLTATLTGVDVDLTWQPAEAEGDLSGYRIYYDDRRGAPYLGSMATEGVSPIELTSDITTLTLHALPQGRMLYAVVTAFDMSGNESLPSQEVGIRVTNGIDGDGDGLADDFELAYWNSTSAVDGTSDTDQDGLTEIGEYQRFTLPTDADTDGDGTFDGNEVASGTDPLNPAERPSLIVSTLTVPEGLVDAPYSTQLQAISGTLPYTWTLAYGSLPPGLTLDADGLISGSPVEEGRFPFTVRVQDADGAFDSQRLTAWVQVGTSSLSLQTGWNLVSMPISPTIALGAEDMCSMIEAQGGNAVEIDRWHLGGWDSHPCGESFNNFGLEVGNAYFVGVASSSTWTFSGTPVTGPITYSLATAWNPISLPLGVSYTAAELAAAINAQGGECGEIDRWYAGGWDPHNVDPPINDFPIEAGKGYMIKCNHPSTFVLAIP